MFYYDDLNWQGWTFYIVASDIGLFSVTITRADVEKYQAVKNVAIMSVYTQQLREYLSGKRKCFTLPLDIQGTPFQKLVWHALLTVSSGDVVTYSDIANQIGRPTSVRAVGGAIGKNPLLIVVPCHRVIGKDGTLTGYSSGLDLKRTLLQLENVQI